MSWFGGSISSLTGQLSNLTKDILTEGTEEISDPATELRLAKEKIEELHSYLTSQKLESERIKRVNKDLEEKAESSELQINAISREYRAVLETKERELNDLKRQQAELLEHQARSAVDDGTAVHSSPRLGPSANYDDNSNSFGSFNYGEDTADWDFDDSIRLQRENNRLRSDFQKASAEAKHWRSVAGQLGQKSESQDEVDSSSTTILQLQHKIKDLESALSKKGEELQQQATSLHEHHRHKVTTLKERHTKDVKSLQEKLSVLEQQLSDGSSGSQHSGLLPESDRPNVSSHRVGELERKLATALSEKEKAQNARVHLEGVLEELQQEVERLQDLNEKQEHEAQGNDQVESLQAQVAELSRRFEESKEENKQLKSKLKNAHSGAVRDKHNLLGWLDANHADVTQTLGELKELRESWDTEAFHRRDKMRVERRHLVNQMFHVGHKKNEALASLVDVKEEKDGVMAKLEELVSSIGDEDYQRKTAELLNLIDKENLLLKEQKTKLEEQVVLLEKTSSNQMKEKQSLLETMATLKSGQPLVTNDDIAASETDGTLDTKFSSSSTDSTSDVRDEDIDAEVSRLRSTLEKMKEESSQLEAERSDWMIEKETLEDILSDLQQKSKDQEDEIMSLKSAESAQLSNENQQLDDSEAKIEELENEVASLKEQNSELETAIEELDTQHTEALAQLISQRDKMAVQLSDQETEINQYRTEIHTLNEKLEQMQNESDDDRKQSFEKCQKYEQELMQWKEKSKNADIVEKKVMELKEKLDKGALVINDLHMDKQDLEEQLQKAQKEIDAKVSKLKESRMEKVEIGKEKRAVEENLRECEEKLLETEVELEKWQQMNEDNQTQGLDRQQSNQEAEIECSHLRSKIEDMKNEKEAIKEEFQFLIDGKIEQQSDHRSPVKDSAFRHIFEEELRVRQKLEEDDKIIRELKEYIEKLRSERSVLKENISALKSVQIESDSLCESLQHEKAKLVKQLTEKTNDVDNMEIQLTEAKNELSVVSIEKGKLQSDLTRLEKEKLDIEDAYMNEEKQNKAYIEELKAGKEESGKQSLESIKDMNAEMERLKEKAKGVEEIKKTLSEKIQEIESLRTDNELCKDEMKSVKAEILRMESLCKEKDSEIKLVREELAKNEETIQELKSRKEELEAKMNQAQDQVALLSRQHDIGEQSEKEKVVKLHQDIEALRNERDGHALTIVQLENELSVSEEKLTSLNEELLKATNEVKAVKMSVSNDGNENVEEVMQVAVSKPLLSSYPQTDSQDTDYQDDDYNRFAELEKEMEELRGRLIEKDGIVSDLQRSNTSLLELLEKKADGDSNLGNRLSSHKLEAELKNLRGEREQMMAVVSEKSRENSSLKSEIHRLMDLVAAGQAALAKVQQDNVSLEQRQHTPPREEDDEMKREALNNMARLVRDRDTEIEALTQKNETLLAVLQESNESNAAAHLGPLLKEKETLTQQINSMLTEREQLIACVTQKHSESLAFHAEVQRLSGLLVETQEIAEKAKAEYAALIPSYEGKNQSLLTTHQELVECKQKLTELEIRHGELMIQTSNNQQQQHRSPDSPTTDDLEAEIEKYKRLEADYKSMVQERDEQIHSLSHKGKTFKDAVSSKEAECTHLRKQLENSKFQLTGLMAEIADVKSEREQVQQKSASQGEESVSLRNSLNQMTLAVKDKDVEIVSLKDQISTLNSVLQGQKGDEDQVSQLIRDQETAVAASRQLQQERDRNAMVAEQRFQECEALKAELSSQKDKVFKMGRELERLRGHLIEIEEGYTKEALEAEEREKELRNKLAVAEEQLMTSSSHVQLASQESQRQIESLQDQLHHIASQRDAAYMQVATTQDQCQQYAASLSNLQLVLEHFQKEKDSAIALETEKYHDQANCLSAKVKELEKELKATRSDLTEALDGLEAASRLSEQLDRKEEALMALKEEVQLREQALKGAEEEIAKLNSSKEAKVDKTLMHNMVLTWLTSPEKKRNEIVQLIGHVLDFSADDFSKIQSAHSQDSLWIGFFKRPSKTPPATPMKGDQSFSQLFVKFLEKESSPAPDPIQLPVEAMAAEAQQRHKTAFNPFMAPRHVTHGNEAQGLSANSSSHLLIPQDNPHPSPLFAPVTSVSSAGESAILKDVLDWKR